MTASPKEAIRSILSARDIRTDGARPWDLRVLDERFYGRVLAGGSLAFGESYMDGWWASDQVDEAIARILQDDPSKDLGMPWSVVAQALYARAFNPQDPRAAFRNGQAHYDIGNDLYRAMLDPRMVYTCAYWKDA